MKVKIIRTDGTCIDAEGTPEEIAKLVPPMPLLQPRDFQFIIDPPDGRLPAGWGRSEITYIGPT